MDDWYDRCWLKLKVCVVAVRPDLAYEIVLRLWNVHRWMRPKKCIYRYTTISMHFSRIRCYCAFSCLQMCAKPKIDELKLKSHELPTTLLTPICTYSYSQTVWDINDHYEIKNRLPKCYKNGKTKLTYGLSYRVKPEPSLVRRPSQRLRGPPPASSLRGGHGMVSNCPLCFTKVTRHGTYLVFHVRHHIQS